MSVTPARRAWLIGIAAFVVVAVAATVLVIVLRKRDDQAAAPPEPTIWERIEMSADKNGVMGLEPALQAFAYLFGEMPGVAAPQGQPDAPDFAVSGSGPLRWVLRHWDKLTEEQRQAVQRVVATPADIPRLRTPGPLKLSSAQQPGARENTRRVLQEEVDRLQAEIGKRLGLTIPPVRLILSDLEVGGSTRAWTIVMASGEEPGANGRDTESSITVQAFGAGPAERCFSYVPPSMWKSVSAPVRDDFRQTLAHEITHCYQGHTYPTVQQFRDTPGWILDGGADFAGSDVVKHAPQNIWSLYLHVQGPLFVRTYSAMGFWFHLQHRGHDPWKAFPTIWKGAQDSPIAYRTARGDAENVYDTWASSFMRSDGFGEAWQAYGQDIPTGVGPRPVSRDAANAFLHVDAYDTRIAAINVPQPHDTIVRLSADHPVRLHDSGSFEKIRLSNDDYCTGGECVCPKDTKKAGHQIPRAQAPLFVAVPGGEGGNSASSKTMSLREYCEEKEDEKKCPAGLRATAALQQDCGGQAGSNGEPHLTSFDGREFDFQAGGEFTLARSDSGDLEIQARQEPLRFYGEENLAISVNTAVAARVGQDRVGMYATPDGLRVRINGGEPKELTDEQRLPNGGSVAPLGTSDGEIRWPDGTTLSVVRIAEFGLNLIITPVASRMRTLHGMLGPYEGVANNPTMEDRSGKRYDSPNTDALYKVIGDSWRVRQADSLFDYGPGQSTETFTRREMPTKLIKLSDLLAEQRAAGEAACAAVTDPNLREQCIFDVALTGDKKFVDSYQSVQRIISRGGLRDGATVSGDISKPGEVDSYEVDLAAGEEFRLADETGDDVKVELVGADESGEHVGPGTISNLLLTSFRVTAAGTYHLRVEKGENATGQYSFRVVMLKQRRAEAKIGENTTARLDIPGRVAVYAFDPGGAGQVRVVNDTCGEVWIGMAEDGPELDPGSNPACLGRSSNTFVLEPGKRHVLVIWSDGAKVEDFKFRIER